MSMIVSGCFIAGVLVGAFGMFLHVLYSFKPRHTKMAWSKEEALLKRVLEAQTELREALDRLGRV